MILTRSFNFVHIMKTGGTWMLRALEQMPRNYLVKATGHDDYSTIGPTRAAMPTYAIIRNPWDWYVSMYCYLQDVMKGTRQDFAKPFEELDEGRQRLYKLYTQSFEDVMRAEVDYRRELHSQIRVFCHRDDGLHEKIRWLRFEDGMWNCLNTMLDETGAPRMPVARMNQFKQRGKINSIQRPHYSTFYTPELRDIVANLEGDVIERFSYQFENP